MKENVEAGHATAQAITAVLGASAGASTVAGTHLCADLWGCDPSLLIAEERLRELAIQAAGDVGATVLGVSAVSFPPRPPLAVGGVTVVVVLAESHLAIHTYPEAGYVAIDIFTCGSGLEPRRGYVFLKDRLAPSQDVVTVIRRGVPTGAPAIGA